MRIIRVPYVVTEFFISGTRSLDEVNKKNFKNRNIVHEYEIDWKSNYRSSNGQKVVFKFSSDKDVSTKQKKEFENRIIMDEYEIDCKSNYFKFVGLIIIKLFLIMFLINFKFKF
jgi:hypothetical protein